MSTLDWSTSGLGLLSIVLACLIYIAFRKRMFGVLDPMALFLITRVVPLVAVIMLMMSSQAFFNAFFLLMAASTLIFIITLYISTPRLRPRPVPCEQDVLKGLFRAAVVITLLKASILFTSSGPLPIFGESGSDSFISFGAENKIGSSFLLAVGSAEVILFSFIIPLARGKTRFASILLLLLAAMLSLANGKKASLLSFLIFVALGEYLRIYFVQAQHRYFLKSSLLLPFGLGAIGWAGWIYSSTGADIGLIGLDSMELLLDLTFMQWAYPFFLFGSGELSSFFEAYHVNTLRYFFHTVLSPLGFPAFSASIGPAFHEFQTGELTGHGINPTFVLEGYVLVGVFLPLYALAVAFAIGRIRHYVLSRKGLSKKVLYVALFLPPVYVMPADALLFMKMLFGLMLILPILHLLLWMQKNGR